MSWGETFQVEETGISKALRQKDVDMFEEQQEGLYGWNRMNEREEQEGPEYIGPYRLL